MQSLLSATFTIPEYDVKAYHGLDLEQEFLQECRKTLREQRDAKNLQEFITDDMIKFAVMYELKGAKQTRTFTVNINDTKELIDNCMKDISEEDAKIGLYLAWGKLFND